MTNEEKSYIASRYYDYANSLKDVEKNRIKAEAIKQLMDYFEIDELDEK